jgi:hypothetical protein
MGCLCEDRPERAEFVFRQPGRVEGCCVYRRRGLAAEAVLGTRFRHTFAMSNFRSKPLVQCGTAHSNVISDFDNSRINAAADGETSCKRQSREVSDLRCRSRCFYTLKVLVARAGVLHGVLGYGKVVKIRLAGLLYENNKESAEANG